MLKVDFYDRLSLFINGYLLCLKYNKCDTRRKECVKNG
jgi:hypothetical protein